MTSIIILIRLEAGEPVSASYSNLYLPTTNIILHSSVFNGWLSYTRLIYVTLRLVGTYDGSMYFIVSTEAIT